MDQSKIYIERKGRFIIVAAEGNAPSIREGVERYKQSGKYKDSADIGPVILGSSDENDFLAINIYGNRFSSLTVVQHRVFKPDTSLVASGITDSSLELLVDVVDVFKLDPKTPSPDLIRSANGTQSPMYLLYRQLLSTFGDETIVSRIISLSYKSMQDRYRQDAKKESIRHN